MTQTPTPIQAVVKRVTQSGKDKWDVALEGGDIWLTVHRHEIGGEPERGDILTIIPPHCIGRAKP